MFDPLSSQRVGKKRNVSQSEEALPFKERVDLACDTLKKLKHNPDDIFATCQAVVKKYKELVSLCDGKILEITYLKEKFESVFTPFLESLLDEIDSQIDECRGRTYYFDLMGVVASSSILDRHDSKYKIMHESISGVIHRLVQCELAYLEFRNQCSDHRGIKETVNSLDKILDEDKSCFKSRFFTLREIEYYRSRLHAIIQTLKNAPPEGIKDSFVAAISEGNLLKASSILKNEVRQMSATFKYKKRTLDDLILHDIVDISKKKQNLEFSNNVNMLKSLCTFSETYQDVLCFMPLVRKALKVLCRSTVKKGLFRRLADHF
ncbi:hypothetical protein [Parendozoicomonas sp. Alg238-R29]|uniref:hypothetical protein n=1 Tax=Parendozoicomonas sp. Alg238-R29 TaxID=2993446 RepID=UPI00248E33D3|nr:hypothetical protein [Parendozoicomonas sp. Alg238-R29]